MSSQRLAFCLQRCRNVDDGVWVIRVLQQASVDPVDTEAGGDLVRVVQRIAGIGVDGVQGHLTGNPMIPVDKAITCMRIVCEKDFGPVFANKLDQSTPEIVAVLKSPVGISQHDEMAHTQVVGSRLLLFSAALGDGLRSHAGMGAARAAVGADDDRHYGTELAPPGQGASGAELDVIRMGSDCHHGVGHAIDNVERCLS